MKYVKTFENFNNKNQQLSERIANKKAHATSNFMPKNEMDEKYVAIDNKTGKKFNTVKKLKTKASIRANIKFYSKEDYPIDITFYNTKTDDKVAVFRNKYAEGGHYVEYFD